MAGVTSPDNISYMTTGDNVTPSSESSTQATSIQNAFNARVVKSFKWANAAARIAQTGMTEGDYGDQADSDLTYRYDGSQWLITSAAIIRGRPSSVSGVNATLNNDGTVSLTNSTGSITLLNCNGAFKTTVDIYFPTNTVNSVQLQLASNTGTVEASGVNGTSGKYDRQTMSATGVGTPATSQALKNTQWVLSNGTAAMHHFQIVLFGANAATPTVATNYGADVQNPMTTSAVISVNTYLHSDSIAYPSLVISPSFAATGTIKVSQG